MMIIIKNWDLLRCNLPLMYVNEVYDALRWDVFPPRLVPACCNLLILCEVVNTRL